MAVPIQLTACGPSLVRVRQSHRAYRPSRIGYTQLRGHAALIFFGFTHCPDACPSTLLELDAAMSAPDPDLRDVAIVMISVEGDRDVPSAIKAYRASFATRCIGLTGDPGLVRQVAARSSSVFFKGLPDKPGGAYPVEHTSGIYLVDQLGMLRATFYDASAAELSQAAAAVARERQ